MWFLASAGQLVSALMLVFGGLYLFAEMNGMGTHVDQAATIVYRGLLLLIASSCLNLLAQIRDQSRPAKPPIPPEPPAPPEPRLPNFPK